MKIALEYLPNQEFISHKIIYILSRAFKKFIKNMDDPNPEEKISTRERIFMCNIVAYK
jgi:hypothetical protein